MINCSVLFSYPKPQNERSRLMDATIPHIYIISALFNLCTILLILTNQSLRKQSLGSLKLFIFSFGGCIFNTNSMLHKGIQGLGRSEYYVQFISFFLIGQIMSITIVTIERIYFVSGTMTSVNSVTRVGSRGKIRFRLLKFILGAVVFNAILSGVVPHPHYIVSLITILNIALYVVLVVKVSRLKTFVEGAVMNVKRKALLYVTILFVGFVVEFVIFFIQGMLYRKQMLAGCPVKLTIEAMIVTYINSLRFAWEPASYFLFNTVPRKLFIEKCKKMQNKITCYCTTQEENCEAEAKPAVIPIS